jgi:hypothetical protein
MASLDGCLSVASLYFAADKEEEEEEREKSMKVGRNHVTIQFEKCRKKRLGKS